MRQVGGCLLHCQVPSLAGRSHRVHPQDREGAGPSSSRGHQQPYLWGSKATFLRHASHWPALLERQGWLSVWELLFFLLYVRTCPVTGPCSTTGAHKVRTGVSIPNPRAKSPCHHLTMGWPPTWYPAGTVTRDSRGILTHRDRA